MKKDDGKKLTEVKKLKKLRLSRETIRELMGSDAEKAAGGNQTQSMSVETDCPRNCEGDTMVGPICATS